MTSFHAVHIRRCLLTAAIAQVLVVLPAMADTVADPPAAAMAPSAAPAAGPAQDGASNDQKKPVVLKEVVVTAQRRTQNLQVVPIAVTAIEGVDLEARGILNVADLKAAAPGIVVMNGTGGNPTTAQIAIRGSFAGNPAMYWDSPVGIYLDGVYIGKAEGSVFNLPDIERIEVLRGPQGTLYGRNTMGGAVNLVTQKPSGVWGGTASLGYGKYNDRVGRVVLDLPAMGKLKASIGGRVDKRDGWVKTTPGSSTSRLGTLDDKNAFVALHLDATDNLSFDYRYDYSKANDTPFSNQVIHSDVLQTFHIPGIIVNKDRQDTASIDYPVFENMRIDGNALTGTWNLGDAGTIKYIGAHREMKWNDGLDLDGSPVPFAQSNAFQRYRQTSHELQYLGSAGRWNWVTGLYYFEDDGHVDNPQSYFFGAARYNSAYGFGTRSRAVYGQVDYKLADKWTLTAGLRRTLEQKRVSRYWNVNGFVVIPQGTAAKDGFSATTPMASLAYQMTPNNMFYAKYSKGFMSGGFNAEAATVAGVERPFLPETAQTYELGSKNLFLGGRASVNADVFYMRTNNLQSVVFTAQGSTASNVLNVGKSHTEGLELEAEWLATEDLRLHATYTYMHSKFDTYMQLGQNIASNMSVMMMPRHMGSLDITDTFLRTSNGTLRGTLDYRVMSGYYRYSYQLKVVNPSQAIAANSWIKGYGTVNAQLAFGGMDWGHGIDGEVSLYVHNLTNVAHIDNIIDFGPSFGNLRTANWNMPRTFGVNVTARW